MRYQTHTVTTFSLLSFFAAGFFSPPLALAQNQGRSVSPPVFPQCTTKISAEGDRKHETTGDHRVPGKETVNGRLDTYTLTDGNFVSCVCAGEKGTQIDWWYINGLPLGRVDIDAYLRDGWVLENGRNWELLDGQYLAKTGEFTCRAQTQNTAAPTRTPTPTRRVTQAPDATATNTPTPRNNENEEDDSETEELPTTGIPPVVSIGLSSLGALGYFLRKKYYVQ